MTGTVASQSGQPVAGAKVRIGNQIATTDTAGKFALADVSAPYVVSTTHPEIPKVAVVYDGLTRPDPTLYFTHGDPPPKHGSIQGMLAGGAGFPNPPQHWYTVAFGSADVFGTATMSLGSGGDYQLSPTWHAPGDTQPGVVAALQFMGLDPDNPTSFTGFGTAAAVVTAGSMETVPTIQLGPVSTDVIAGQVTASWLPAAVLFRVFAVVNPDVSVFVPQSDGTMGPYSVMVPTGQGLQTAIAVLALGTNGDVGAFRTNLTAPNSAVDFVLPDIPQLEKPLETDIVPPGTTFAISPLSAVKKFSISDGANYYTIWTSNNEVILPDLAADGVAWIGGSEGTWRVSSYPSLATLDNAAGPAGSERDMWRVLAQYAPTAGSADFAYATANTVSFLTAN